MKRKKVILALGIVVLVIIIFLLIVNAGLNAYVVKNLSEKPIPISYSNIEKELSKIDVIQALPKKTYITLEFYSYPSGTRTTEKVYTLSRASFKEGNYSNPSVRLSIHSKYLTELTNKNLCETIKKAINKGDAGFETKLSKLALLWKFKSFLKYRSCLGL